MEDPVVLRYMEPFVEEFTADCSWYYINSCAAAIHI